MSRLEFDVFGHRIVVERRAGRWVALHPASDGKRRPIPDLVIPPDLEEEELGEYLADVRHEWATPESPEVKRID